VPSQKWAGTAGEVVNAATNTLELILSMVAGIAIGVLLADWLFGPRDKK
jgi:hypothetical protein